MDSMRCTYICYLGDELIKEVIGRSHLKNVAKLGYDASNLCAVKISGTVRLKIYKELRGALPDIYQNTSRREPLLMSTETARKIIPGLEGIGEGCVVPLVAGLEEVQFDLITLMMFGNMLILSSQEWKDYWRRGWYDIIRKVAFQSTFKREKMQGGDYVWVWGASNDQHTKGDL